jgi:chromate transporter
MRAGSFRRPRRMSAAGAGRGSFAEVFGTFLRLGLTSFGGPVAHLGYFRSEVVERRKWLGEAAYADIVALCQFLPGPASSQVGVTLGILRAGLPGGLAAWLGFTMPSALAMIAFAYGVAFLGDLNHAAWLHGLKIVAVAVVAQAVWGMARKLCPDRPRMTLAVAAALLVLAVPSALGQIGAIIVGGLVGWRLLAAPAAPAAMPSDVSVGVRMGRGLSVAALAAFFGLLLGLPLLVAATGDHTLDLFSRFYRSGALVFGGGHLILPLLQQSVVPPGWVSNDTFLAGYGAAQAVPGPLSTFAAYLGTVLRPWPNGWAGGLICLGAIYLPSFLLLVGILPFWDALRRRPAVQAALRGVNAAVVGLLLAALYTPVWTSAINGPTDFGIGIAAFLLLAVWHAAPWLVVILGAGAAAAVALLGAPV